MGEEKARPSIMDEQNQAPAETMTEGNTQEQTLQEPTSEKSTVEQAK